jgi:hypothetical protein
VTGIVEFLTARLDEDEATANRAINPVPRQPTDSRNWSVEEFVPSEEGAVPAVTWVSDQEEMGVAQVNGDAKAVHIARHDPARVLADVAAKRAIIEWHAVRRTARDARDPEEQATVDICWCGYDRPCATLRHLAAPYADHPGYDPTWRLA